jgi:predicted aspartyl protease
MVSPKDTQRHFRMPEPSPRKVILEEGIIPLYVEIEGPTTKRIIKMALDTGATFTMMPPEIARDIGHDPTLTRRRIEVATASGSVLVPILKVKSISCLGTKLKNVEVVCHSLPPESPVEGLLGLNFLVHLPAFIEFCQKIPACI